MVRPSKQPDPAVKVDRKRTCIMYELMDDAHCSDWMKNVDSVKDSLPRNILDQYC